MDKVRVLEIIEMELGCDKQVRNCGGMCEVCCYGQYSREEKVEALEYAHKELKRNIKSKGEDENEN